MSKPILLCVDDEKILLESLRIELRREVGDEFDIEVAESGETALMTIRQFLQEGSELVMVICDEKMPGMKGHELLAEIRQLSPETSLVLLTGYTDLDAIRRAVNTGGLYRYMNKPWSIEELSFTIHQARQSQTRQRTIVDQRSRIGRLTKSMIFALEAANQNSDEDTAYHIERVSEFSAILAQQLGQDAHWVERIRLYAGLHDIGKVGVQCQLLGIDRYTDKERELQKLHVNYGGQILSTEGIDPMASNIARFHHERWDGHGYLTGISGEQIPLEARIIALVDVFDALSSPRSYRTGLPFDQSVEHILEMGGTWFDPRLVLAFRECRQDLRLARDRVNARTDLQKPFAFEA